MVYIQLLMYVLYIDFDWSLIAWVDYIYYSASLARSLFREVVHIYHHWHMIQGTAEQRCAKPQSTKSQYVETAMDPNGTNNTEYAMVAHSNTSAKGHLAQGPSRQANTTCTSGPGNSPLEYATVQDALHVTDNITQNRPSLTNTPSLPPCSPPAPPCSPPGVGISPDCVQDVGYASLPDSRNGSNRITKVRSLRQK